MAKPKKTQKQTGLSWKRKRWYKILSPKLFNETIIGETPAFEPSNLTGRTVKLNLMNITRDMKNQNVNITFEVDAIVGENAKTQIKKYELLPASIKRMVRRRKNRIDDSFLCKTSDNIQVRLKPMILTRNITKGSVVKALRKSVVQQSTETIGKMRYEDLMREIIGYRFQRNMRDFLKKVYPLKSVEIRVINVEKDKKAAKVEVTEEVKGEEAAEEKKEEPKEEVKEEKAEKPKEEKKVEKKAEEKPEEKSKEAPKEAVAEEKTEEKVEEVKEKKE